MSDMAILRQSARHTLATRERPSLLNNPEAHIAGERAARRGHRYLATTLAHEPVIDSICVSIVAGDSARVVDAEGKNVGVWIWRGEGSEVARRISGETESR